MATVLNKYYFARALNTKIVVKNFQIYLKIKKPTENTTEKTYIFKPYVY